MIQMIHSQGLDFKDSARSVFLVFAFRGTWPPCILQAAFDCSDAALITLKDLEANKGMKP